MSSTTAKRSKDKDGGKRRSKTPGSKKGGKEGKASRGRSKSKDAGKKRRSSSSKKDGRAKTQKPKSLKRQKQEEDVAAKDEKPESARNIKVDWHGPKDKTGSTKWAIRGNPFRRLVNHYAREITENDKLPDMRMASDVARSIQSAVEGEVAEILRQAACMAMHAKRTTVQDEDVNWTSRFRRPIDVKDSMHLYTSLIAKRGGTTDGQAPRTSGHKRPKAAKVAGDGVAPAAAGVDGAAEAPKKKKGGKKKSADGAAAPSAPADPAAAPVA